MKYLTNKQLDNIEEHYRKILIEPYGVDNPKIKPEDICYIRDLILRIINNLRLVNINNKLFCGDEIPEHFHLMTCAVPIHKKKDAQQDLMLLNNGFDYIHELLDFLYTSKHEKDVDINSLFDIFLQYESYIEISERLEQICDN